MKIIFMGTPDFSSAVLEKLNSVYPVAAVVTGEDKASGRHNKIRFSPVKEKAVELGLPVLQYAKVSKEGVGDIAALSPDIIVTAAFGQILSEEFLAIPKYGVLNVHASLLPKYRGASPIQWAVLNGDKETGITVMRTVKAVDAGDILLKKVIEIGRKETAGELFDRLAELGGEAIVEAIKLVESGDAVYTPQDGDKATFCSMISKSDGKIDFSRSARELDCFVRGMTPWPSAYFFLNGKSVKVFDVEDASDGFIKNFSDGQGRAPLCGEVIAANDTDGFVVACGSGAVKIKELCVEGSRRMTDKEMLRGRKIPLGTVLE